LRDKQQQYRPSSNQQPNYNQTTVIVQPSPTYGGAGGGYGGYNRSGVGSSLASAGLGFAGGAVLGGKILEGISRKSV
jgi:hypothetical protein